MHSIAIRILEWNARRRLRGHQHLNIASSAKVQFRSLKLGASNRLSVGEGSIVGCAIAFERDGAEVLVGANTFIGASTIVCATRVEIGDDVLVSWGCTIDDHDSHSLYWSKRSKDVREWYWGRKDWTHVVTAPVKLGNKCWVGMHSLILKGVEIGEGSIVAAGSVVTANVPAWTIVGGSPARLIRAIPPEER